MNNKNTQRLFQFLIFLFIPVVGEIDPYLKEYDSKTFTRVMNIFEINNIPNWKNNIFLKYISIIQKKYITLTLEKELAIYNLKVYADFKYLLPITTNFPNMIYFMNIFGVCSDLYASRYSLAYPNYYIGCNETSKISNFIEIKFLKELDKYIPCFPITIEHRFENNVYKEKLFSITNNNTKGIPTMGIVLYKKEFFIFGYNYEFEYYELSLEEGKSYISEEHVRSAEYCIFWHQYSNGENARIKGYYFLIV